MATPYSIKSSEQGRAVDQAVVRMTVPRSLPRDAVSWSDSWLLRSAKPVASGPVVEPWLRSEARNEAVSFHTRHRGGFGKQSYQKLIHGHLPCPVSVRAWLPMVRLGQAH